MLTHTVFFNFSQQIGETEKASFFKAAQTLSDLPGVENFKVVRQVSHKNNFTHGLTMRFKDDIAFKVYNEHPDHVSFVENVWLKNVGEFLEIDFLE